jgi:hypothetical protein
MTHKANCYLESIRALINSVRGGSDAGIDPVTWRDLGRVAQVVSAIMTPISLALPPGVKEIAIATASGIQAGSLICVGYCKE